MINLRYHIVSITAVFLALAIGIAVGSTLLERATVGTLNDRLDAQAERLDKTDGENSRLRQEQAAEAERQEEVYSQARALFQGHLAGQQILIIAEQGTSEALLEEVRETLAFSDAVVSGVLQVSSRWSSLNPEESLALGALVDVASDNETMVRSVVVNRVADELSVAATKLSTAGEEPGLDEDQFEELEPVEGDQPFELDEEATLEEAEEPAVPDAAIIGALIDLGYLEFFGDNTALPLPDFNMRYVVLVDDASALAPPHFLMPLLRGLTKAGGAPAVVVAELYEEEVEARDEMLLLSATLVQEIRSDTFLGERVSTVDNINEFTGQAALVLELVELFRDQPAVGHFGRGEGSGVMIPQFVGP